MICAWFPNLFNENGAQFCSYLVKRFWLGVAFCGRKDFVQITVQKNVVFEWVIIGANQATSLEVFLECRVETFA